MNNSSLRARILPNIFALWNLQSSLSKLNYEYYALESKHEILTIVLLLGRKLPKYMPDKTLKEENVYC